MSFHTDGYESALLGHRRLQAGQDAPLTELQLYASGGIFGRVVDAPADDAVARGVTIDGDDGRIAAELDRLKVLPALADGIRWARLTGGAVLMPITDDSARLDTPLNVERLHQIQEFRVFDLTDVDAPERRYRDPRKANYGMPEVYRVRSMAPDDGTAVFYVHETRLIPIPGDPLPRRLATLKGVPWAGRTAVERTYRAICRYQEALVLALKVLERKQQGVYGMKGLAEAISNDMEAAVQKRIDLVDAVRGLLNTVAIDSEDEYAIHDANVSGVRDLVNEFQVGVSAECGMPVTILFGRSPAGQNATGEADFDGYYDLVEGVQSNKATPALERIVSLILAQETFANPPEDWSIRWPALSSPTPKEEADVRETNAKAEKAEMEALSLAVDNGLGEDEARAYMTEHGKYGLKPDTGGRAAATKYATETA
ncbi:phage portal protein [Bordetella petrii]|uniref:Anti-CBASS protein Acb1-like N-terminal domain-containing protein n=1 Tax=Bordetella petrii (strain ATCC BAA-461 / DSM 12804 / CCUG 43448 / CIP 107267 / Se-1111R) TaxID=340100 RepID=A9I8Z5_BORPD|nr:DUF1073 domain-containing protein [Bordetella petrii]CAP41309.1 conserved hypothetical protein [Bordetella petrii]